MITAIVMAAVPGGLIAWALYNLFFKHEHSTTWPLKARYKGKEIHYVVCTDCAKAFVYDWTTMERGEELPNDIVGGYPASRRTIRLGRVVPQAKG